jgi:hypothetical protein
MSLELTRDAEQDMADAFDGVKHSARASDLNSWTR